MPYLAKRADPNCPPAAFFAWATTYGDLQCPHCATIIVTPAYCDVKPDWGRCPCCPKPFKVGGFQAGRANTSAQKA